MKELILGGARSGKSAYAERRAANTGLPVTVVVTAEIRDAEMAARIAKHRAARPRDWGVVEAPVGLAAALAEHAREGRCLIVDCLTLWISNLLANVEDGPASIDASTIPLFAKERRALLDQLTHTPGEILIVTNEVGMGIVPLGTVTRLFRDEAGRLNQDVAAACERATFVAAGLPLALKAP